MLSLGSNWSRECGYIYMTICETLKANFLKNGSINFFISFFCLKGIHPKFFKMCAKFLSTKYGKARVVLNVFYCRGVQYDTETLRQLITEAHSVHGSGGNPTKAHNPN